MVKYWFVSSLAVFLLVVPAAFAASESNFVRSHVQLESATHSFGTSALFRFVYGPPGATIKTSNPAINGAFLNLGTDFPDVVRRDDLLKMISQLSPTTITPQEYLDYLGNIPTYTLPKTRLRAFVTAKNFGGKRFLSWLDTQPDNVSLGFFATRVVGTAGQTSLPFTFPHTTLRRLSAVPGSVPPDTPAVGGLIGVGIESRFFIWTGLPPAPLQVDSME